MDKVTHRYESGSSRIQKGFFYKKQSKISNALRIIGRNLLTQA
jgi:hypothetical protein